MNVIESVIRRFSLSGSQQRQINEEESALTLNAWHLACYVMEHKKYLDKVEGFNFGEFFAMCEKFPDMPKGSPEKIRFINDYHKLEQIAENVTARTLVATRIHGRGFFAAMFGTSVGQYLVFLAIVTLLFVIGLVSSLFWPLDTTFVDLIDDETPGYGYYFFYFFAVMVSNSVVMVFCAAGLGTTVYLLRETQNHLAERTFDPALLPGHFIRLLLGVIAGGSLVLFPNTMGSIDDLTINIDSMGIEHSAIAFVLGYGVEIFYEALDGVKEKLRPNRP